LWTGGVWKTMESSLEKKTGGGGRSKKPRRDLNKTEQKRRGGRFQKSREAKAGGETHEHYPDETWKRRTGCVTWPEPVLGRKGKGNPGGRRTRRCLYKKNRVPRGKDNRNWMKTQKTKKKKKRGHKKPKATTEHAWLAAVHGGGGRGKDFPVQGGFQKKKLVAGKKGPSKKKVKKPNSFRPTLDQPPGGVVEHRKEGEPRESKARGHLMEKSSPRPGQTPVVTNKRRQEHGACQDYKSPTAETQGRWDLIIKLETVGDVAKYGQTRRSVGGGKPEGKGTRNQSEFWGERGKTARFALCYKQKKSEERRRVRTWCQGKQTFHVGVNTPRQGPGVKRRYYYKPEPGRKGTPTIAERLAHLTSSG